MSATLERRIEGLEDRAEIERGEREMAELAALSDAELDERIPSLLDRACETHNADPMHAHPHDAGVHLGGDEIEFKDRILRRKAALGYKAWHDADIMARWEHEQPSAAA